VENGAAGRAIKFAAVRILGFGEKEFLSVGGSVA